MRDNDLDCKENYIHALKESLTFFSNKWKLDREKWVVRRLLHALHIDFSEDEIAGAEEPVDVSFRDAKFQVKEILNESRRRTDEFKSNLKKAKTAKDYSKLLEHYTPTDISFSDIVRHCQDYAATLLSQSKYGPLERKNIDLLCYFNWIDYHVVPAIEVQNVEVGFRSLSVVSNRFCAVIYAGSETPQFLKDNVGKAREYFEA
jgi:hypothetical protein